MSADQTTQQIRVDHNVPGDYDLVLIEVPVDTSQPPSNAVPIQFQITQGAHTPTPLTRPPFADQPVVLANLFGSALAIGQTIDTRMYAPAVRNPVPALIGSSIGEVVVEPLTYAGNGQGGAFVHAGDPTQAPVWTISGGSLPAGITLSSAGVLSGTFAEPLTNTTTATVRCTNGNGFAEVTIQWISV